MHDIRYVADTVRPAQSNIHACWLARLAGDPALGGMDQAAVEEMVSTLHGAGVNFFDHSEAYGGANRGAPEAMFGDAVRSLGIKRSDLVPSTTVQPPPAHCGTELPWPHTRTTRR